MKMRARQDASPTLLSNSGDDITLFTGVPAVTLEYGTRGLDPVLERYHPGWLAVWKGHGDKWTAKLATRYKLDEVAHYKVFDDPDRNYLMLYRLKKLESYVPAERASH